MKRPGKSGKSASFPRSNEALRLETAHSPRDRGNQGNAGSLPGGKRGNANDPPSGGGPFPFPASPIAALAGELTLDRLRFDLRRTGARVALADLAESYDISTAELAEMVLTWIGEVAGVRLIRDQHGALVALRSCSLSTPAAGPTLAEALEHNARLTDLLALHGIHPVPLERLDCIHDDISPRPENDR